MTPSEPDCNYMFTGGYYATYYSYEGAKWGVMKGWAASVWTAGKIKQIFSGGHVKRALIFTATAIGKDILSTLMHVNGTPEVTWEQVMGGEKKEKAC